MCVLMSLFGFCLSSELSSTGKAAALGDRWADGGEARKAAIAAKAWIFKSSKNRPHYHTIPMWTIVTWQRHQAEPTVVCPVFTKIYCPEIVLYVFTWENKMQICHFIKWELTNKNSLMLQERDKCIKPSPAFSSFLSNSMNIQRWKL